jgi:hypothetical protein
LVLKKNANFSQNFVKNRRKYWSHNLAVKPDSFEILVQQSDVG